MQDYQVEMKHLSRRMLEQDAEVVALRQGKALLEKELDVLGKLKEEAHAEMEKSRDECRSGQF